MLLNDDCSLRTSRIKSFKCPLAITADLKIYEHLTDRNTCCKVLLAFAVDVEVTDDIVAYVHSKDKRTY